MRSSAIPVISDHDFYFCSILASSQIIFLPDEKIGTLSASAFGLGYSHNFQSKDVYSLLLLYCYKWLTLISVALFFHKSPVRKKLKLFQVNVNYKHSRLKFIFATNLRMDSLISRNEKKIPKTFRDLITVNQ